MPNPCSVSQIPFVNFSSLIVSFMDTLHRSEEKRLFDIFMNNITIIGIITLEAKNVHNAMKLLSRKNFLSYMQLFFLPLVSMTANAQPVEVGPILATVPAGWVKGNTNDGRMSWFRVDPVSGQPTCRISNNMPGFGANPAAFMEVWNNTLALYRLRQTGDPPVLVERKIGDGFTITSSRSVYTYQNNPNAYLAVANVTSPNAGAAFFAIGTVQTCEPEFGNFLNKLRVVHSESVGAPANNSIGRTSPSMSEFYNGVRQEDQRRAAQRDQDRLTQQRDQDRQLQDRLAQQRELDRQMQNRTGSTT